MQVELRQRGHTFERFNPGIAKRRVAQIKETQIDERRKTRSLDFGLCEPQFLEACERRKKRQAFVLHVDVGQKVHAEVQFFQARKVAQGCERIIRIQFAARTRIPHGAGKKQIPETRKILELFEILRVGERTHKVDAFNRKLTGRKFGQVGYRLRSAFEGNVPAQPQ